MGLFSLLSRKNGQSGKNVDSDDILAKPNTDVPEDIFIEKSLTSESGKKQETDETDSTGIQILFAFLDRNHEAKGYDDALINPDSSHLVQNVDALRNEFMRTIRKVKTFYEDFIKEIDFHIASRSRSGLVDTVEELQMKKDIALSHIEKVLQIEEDANHHKGDSEGIIISYTRGFKNGLAAISHHSILRLKF